MEDSSNGLDFEGDDEVGGNSICATGRVTSVGGIDMGDNSKGDFGKLAFSSGETGPVASTGTDSIVAAGWTDFDTGVDGSILPLGDIRPDKSGYK